MAEAQTATLLMTGFVTHDVKRFVLTRPDGFAFAAGHGVELTIDRAGWRDQARPFTPTGRSDDQVLEFTIKSYPEHEGVTQEFHRMEPGAGLLISEPFGTISYQGPGVFIAGGAGITPFLAIFRDRAHAGDVARNALLFSNKTPADMICEKELRHYLGERCVLTCTESRPSPGYLQGRIDRAFLEEHVDSLDQPFYVCGPPGFMDAVTDALQAMGADAQSLVFER